MFFFKWNENRYSARKSLVENFFLIRQIQLKTNESERIIPPFVDCISELCENSVHWKKGPSGVWAIAHFLGCELRNGNEHCNIFIGAVLDPEERTFVGLGLTNFTSQSYFFQWYIDHTKVTSPRISEFIRNLSNWSAELSEQYDEQSVLPVPYVRI
jgi:hypothetical protein